MNYPNPSHNLTGIVPANLVLATKPIDQLLKRIEGDSSGAERLDFAGIEELANAIANGHNVAAICDYLGVSMGSWHYWKRCLDTEQNQYFLDAETSYLENLDSRLREMVAIELHGMYGEDDTDAELKKADLANKRISAIEKLLKATQFHLVRLENRNKQSGHASETHITQMIVSNEWLAALPDE